MKITIEVDEMVCSVCGSGDVSTPVWIHLAPGEWSGFDANDYCNVCDDERRLKEVSDNERA